MRYGSNHDAQLADNTSGKNHEPTISSFSRKFVLQSSIFDCNTSNLFIVPIRCAMFIAFSGDLLTIFVFISFCISTYPLITYSSTKESIIAGRYYFVYFAIPIYGIGKAVLIPMHSRLSKAITAPILVSALLDAVVFVEFSLEFS
ncbi:hypothetical protein DINM_004231 [Dirofilaria immitis]|nr:hypothetical protein [Dirofilaria immitis]